VFTTHYVFTGTGSDKFSVSAQGATVVQSFTQEPSIGYPIGVGDGYYGSGWLDFTPDPLPAHTPITLTITTFSENNYQGSSTTASLAYDCTTGAVIAATSVGGGEVLFTDGRVNNKPGDAAQSAAVYCTSDGGVVVYKVINSVGQKAFSATKKEIDAVPANPDKNTLIKKENGIALYRLKGGKLQINAPKYHTRMGKTEVDPSGEYVFIWDGC
jgi:hypothetical protein